MEIGSKTFEAHFDGRGELDSTVMREINRWLTEQGLIWGDFQFNSTTVPPTMAGGPPENIVIVWYQKRAPE